MKITKKINGKDRGFKFTMKTLEIFSECTGVEFSDIPDHFKGKPFGSIIKLMWSANKVYNRGEEVTEYDIDDWITEMSQEDFQDIWNCFEESTKSMFESTVAKKK